jgi:sporulation protein YlmC with PRC-barrel domain
MGLVVLLVLMVGLQAYGQQKDPSAQQQDTKTSQSETTQTTTTNTEVSKPASSDSQDSPSAQTASTLQGVMLASDLIVGAAVKNEKGEDIGEVQRLLISPKHGVVMYAELGVGGFLGMGEKTIMVPWKAIEIARSGDSLVLNTSKPVIESSQ